MTSTTTEVDLEILDRELTERLTVNTNDKRHIEMLERHKTLPNYDGSHGLQGYFDDIEKLQKTMIDETRKTYNKDESKYSEEYIKSLDDSFSKNKTTRIDDVLSMFGSKEAKERKKSTQNANARNQEIKEKIDKMIKMYKCIDEGNKCQDWPSPIYLGSGGKRKRSSKTTKRRRGTRRRKSRRKNRKKRSK